MPRIRTSIVWALGYTSYGQRRIRLLGISPFVVCVYMRNDVFLVREAAGRPDVMERSPPHTHGSVGVRSDWRSTREPEVGDGTCSLSLPEVEGRTRRGNYAGVRDGEN